MPEHIRALIALLALSVPALMWLRKPLTANAVAPRDYKLRAGVWVALTLALFVAHNFWLFIGIAAVTLLVAQAKDSSPLGLYVFLLFLAPPFQSNIQGFAGIKYFLAIDYLRLLSLVVLLPMALRLLRAHDRARLFALPSDKFLVGYLMLFVVLAAPTTSMTDSFRSIISLFIDVFLPYYVFSRTLTDVAKFRDVLASFAGIGVVMSVVAIFETLKHWLLYSMLPHVLDVTWNFGSYMMREGSLRATVSTGHSIVLGYVLTVALGLHLALGAQLFSRRHWWLMTAALGSGIICSMSRGPWIGAAATVVVALATAPRGARKLGMLAGAAAIALPLLAFTPYGTKFAALLPFVGDADAESVDYRQQLFHVSWDVLMLNPWFGSPNYLANGSMEQLRQGEGIIDMVNSYLGVAMFSGFVGLALFAGVFVASGLGLVNHLRRPTESESEGRAICRALLATLIGVLVTIATVSSINVVPVVYWCLAGACAAYIQGIRRERSNSDVSFVDKKADPFVETRWGRRAW